MFANFFCAFVLHVLWYIYTAWTHCHCEDDKDFDDTSLFIVCRYTSQKLFMTLFSSALLNWILFVHGFIWYIQWLYIFDKLIMLLKSSIFNETHTLPIESRDVVEHRHHSPHFRLVYAIRLSVCATKLFAYSWKIKPFAHKIQRKIMYLN